MKMEPVRRLRFLAAAGVAVLAGTLILSAARAPANPVGGDAVAVDSPSGAPVRAKPRRCLVGGNYDQQIIDDSTLILTDRFSTSVRVKVKGCRLNAMDPLLFEFRGTTEICSPIDLDMSTISAPGFKSRCFVESITPLKRAADGQMTDDKSGG